MATSVVGGLAVWDDTTATTIKQPTSTGELFTKDGVLYTIAQVVNVASYGADATGVADSEVAFQDALTALGTTGGVITGPLGTYTFKKVSQIAHDSLTTGYCVHIDADATHGPITFDFPRGTVFKLKDSQAANSAIILVNGASAGYRAAPTIIRGITFDGNYATQTSWTDHGLVTAIYAYDVIIEECTFKTFPYAGIHILRDCRGPKILNNLIDGTHALTEGTGAGMRVEVQDVLIEGNRFVVDALAGRGHIAAGVNADIDLQGQGMRIIGNVFAGGYNGATVSLAGVSYCQVIGNVWRDVCDTAGWALNVVAYTNSNGTVWDAAFNVIEGNTFFNVRQGIQLSSTHGTINSVKYTVGAIANIVANNIISSDPIALKTSLGGANTYPDRFSPAPNAAAVNLATGIQLNGADNTSGSQPVTSSTSTVITNSGGAYSTNAYQNYILVVTGGTGKGQVRKIASNTGTTVTVSTAFDVTPDATSTWRAVDLCGFNRILGNIIHATNNTTKGIDDESWLPQDIVDNTVYNSNTGSTAFTINNPVARLRGNKAFANALNTGAVATHPVYQDENSGTASVLTGTTTIVVTHKLGRTPTADQIMVWPITTNGSATEWWVDTITSTQFTINVDVNPAGTYSFGWRAFGSA